MPGITRVGDSCTGHDDCDPRQSTSGSPNVFVNGIAVHRNGDAWSVHCDHDGELVSSSSTVFINGVGCGRIGDSISCGSTVATGSDNVFAG